MKDLSKPAQFGVVAATLVVIALAVWFVMKATPDSGEPSAELRNQQIEYQKSLTPGGGKPPAAGAVGGAPAGLSAGKPAYTDQPAPGQTSR